MFEVGQKVIVTGNRTNHGFEIGQTVIVDQLGKDGAVSTCAGEDDYWYMSKLDITPLVELIGTQLSEIKNISGEQITSLSEFSDYVTDYYENPSEFSLEGDEYDAYRNEIAYCYYNLADGFRQYTDLWLRANYPANVEGSAEFNAAHG